MDDKRTIDLSKIDKSGYLIARCGRFAVYLSNTGEFTIATNTDHIDGINCSNLRDIHDAVTIIREWLSYHKFKQAK